MASDITPTSTTTDADPASRGRAGGGRRQRRVTRLSRVAAAGLIVVLTASCTLFPDGSWTTKDPVAGEPALAWNDPDDALTDSPIDLEDVGYVEAEHFIGGGAAAYARVGTWDATGRWQAQPATSKGFATRILVRRPADPDAFNGVVVVEWLNVTSGSDLDALFRPTHTELLGKGYAWVGVSAQKVGVDALKQQDPERYKNLQHRGDAYAYDMFTRAGRIVADPTSPVLGGLQPQVVLASGASQSASALHQRRPPARPRLRRLPADESAGLRLGVGRRPSHAGAPDHPHRCRRAGARRAVRERHRRVSYAPQPAEGPPQLPAVGAGGLRPHRRVRPFPVLAAGPDGTR